MCVYSLDLWMGGWQRMASSWPTWQPWRGVSPSTRRASHGPADTGHSLDTAPLPGSYCCCCCCCYCYYCCCCCCWGGREGACDDNAAGVGDAEDDAAVGCLGSEAALRYLHWSRRCFPHLMRKITVEWQVRTITPRIDWVRVISTDWLIEDFFYNPSPPWAVISGLNFLRRQLRTLSIRLVREFVVIYFFMSLASQ